MKLSDLFYKYIKDKHLGGKGVSAEDLAIQLEAAGFLTLTGTDGHNPSFEWTEKALNGNFKKEFWKVIDSCTASGNPTFTEQGDSV